SAEALLLSLAGDHWQHEGVPSSFQPRATGPMLVRRKPRPSILASSAASEARTLVPAIASAASSAAVAATAAQPRRTPHPCTSVLQSLLTPRVAPAAPGVKTLLQLSGSTAVHSR